MSAPAMPPVPGLAQLLLECRRRIRIQGCLRGSLETLLAVITGILFACLVDFLIPLPAFVRLLLLLLFLVTVAAVSWLRMIRPACDQIVDEELGAAIDLQYPELQEAIATAVTLNQADRSPAEIGSLAMRRHLVESIQNRLRAVTAASVITSTRTLRISGVAAGAVFLFLIPFLVWPSGSQLLLKRFAMPFANLETATNLYFEIPVADRIVARGSDVRFEAIPRWRTQEAGKLPDSVAVHLRSEVDSDATETLQMAWDELAQMFV
ncbi:MAG: hypothetical protein KDA85_22315, partial [Planctomycetaceae bacterium]|nr:hypothetical protein [Planctomycetaceae bacterium]